MAFFLGAQHGHNFLQSNGAFCAKFKHGIKFRETCVFCSYLTFPASGICLTVFSIPFPMFTLDRSEVVDQISFPRVFFF